MQSEEFVQSLYTKRNIFWLQKARVNAKMCEDATQYKI